MFRIDKIKNNRSDYQKNIIMKKILLLVSLIFCLCSCQPKVVRESIKVYEAYFKYVLKDPSSLTIHSAKGTTDGHFAVRWEIDYSANNSYGGKVRKTIKFETFGEFYKVDGDLREIKELKDYMR